MSSLGKCPSCGASEAWIAFSGESRGFGPASSRYTVDNLSGHRCGVCGEEVFSSSSNELIADAVNLANRRKNADFVKSVRRNKLSITQIDAVRYLSGGGHNAFSRYEKSEVQIPRPLLVLMHLLDAHPNLYEEIKAMRIRS